MNGTCTRILKTLLSPVSGFLVYAYLLLPVKARAVSLENPIAVDTIEELLEALISIILVFATPLIVFFIVYAGFLYVTARGNEQTITQANRALLYAIIGGLLILGAFALITIVGNLINSVASNP